MWISPELKYVWHSKDRNHRFCKAQPCRLLQTHSSWRQMRTSNPPILPAPTSQACQKNPVWFTPWEEGPLYSTTDLPFPALTTYSVNNSASHKKGVIWCFIRQLLQAFHQKGTESEARVKVPQSKGSQARQGTPLTPPFTPLVSESASRKSNKMASPMIRWG